jgi:hypothetical protein
MARYSAQVTAKLVYDILTKARFGLRDLFETVYGVDLYLRILAVQQLFYNGRIRTCFSPLCGPCGE